MHLLALGGMLFFMNKIKNFSNVVLFFAALLFVSAVSPTAQAACRVIIAPSGQGIATITSPSMGGGDDDAQILWDLMNVPPQDSIMGPGKAIVTAGKELNFICNLRGGSIPFCTITLNAKGPRGSEWITLDPARKSARLLMTGDEAAAIAQKLHLAADGTLKYVSSDNKLLLQYHSSTLEILYSEQGL